jgi:hypothetical protein
VTTSLVLCANVSCALSRAVADCFRTCDKRARNDVVSIWGSSTITTFHNVINRDDTHDKDTQKGIPLHIFDAGRHPDKAKRQTNLETLRGQVAVDCGLHQRVRACPRAFKLTWLLPISSQLCHSGLSSVLGLLRIVQLLCIARQPSSFKRVDE